MSKKNLILIFILFNLIVAGCGTLTGSELVFKTADPRLSFGFYLVTPVDAPALPTVTPTIAPEVVPAEEVGETLPDPTPAPPAIVVKGNISRSGEKIYHLPGGAYYDQVKIDEAEGEKFFNSEQEAIDAGWRKATR